MSRRHALLSLWAAPLVLVALTVFGLASALLGDDLWDQLSWATLAVPLIVCLWFALRRPPLAQRGSDDAH